jgi:hypothetical protein
MDEEYRKTPPGSEKEHPNLYDDLRDDFRRPNSSRTSPPPAFNTTRMIQRLIDEKSTLARKYKWIGRGLMVFGGLFVLGAFPFLLVSLFTGVAKAGLVLLGAGLAMIGGGFGFSSRKPRLKDTNEALVIAANHGYRLTVPRLALEMDISFEKAESIIQEIVRSGIAEVDISSREPDNAVVYVIRGL